jgi:murein L,D-transpeptidase YafK
LTPANLARHRTNPHVAFWQMLKIGNDHFEATHLEPKVDVCDRRYVFDAQPSPNSSKPLVFNPTGRCPTFAVNPKIARPALEKQHADDVEYAQLVEDNESVAPILNLHRTRRRNEQGFPRTLSGQCSIVRKSVSACISTAAIATRPLG